MLAPDEQRVSRDSALQIARRIDWRFLLPNPHLGQVAYMGQPRQTLLTALGYFSESLRLFSLPDQTTHCQHSDANFELVVLRSLSMTAVEKAHALLIAGGYLYWEIDRMSRFAPLGRFLRRADRKALGARPLVRDPRACLEQLGFCDIRIYWHRPNFETCREIIPLYDQHAMAYVFSRDRKGLSGQFKRVTGRFLRQTGLLPRLVPYYSVVACKGSTLASSAPRL